MTKKLLFYINTKPQRAKHGTLSQIFYFILRRDPPKKMSDERRDYESVDDKSLL